MAETMHLDTLALAQKLKGAGFTEVQVETLIDLARETTPRDLVTNASLDSRLAATEATLDQRLTILEQRMTIKLGGLIVAAVAFIVTFLRLFPPTA